MTNDELLAEWEQAQSDGDWVWVKNAGDALAAALRASEEEYSELMLRHKAVLQGVMRWEKNFAAAENVIREALAEAQSQMDRDDMSKWGEHGRYSAGSDLHEVLSSYKPEEGKN